MNVMLRCVPCNILSDPGSVLDFGLMIDLMVDFGD